MNAKSKNKHPFPSRENKENQNKIDDSICFLCGICCVKYHVHVTMTEAHRIADELGVSWDEWQAKYIEKRWPRFDSYLLHRNENGTCIFLEQVAGSKVSRCRIHPFRPSSCREWTPGLYRPECQEGLFRFWQLTVNKEGNIAGTPEKLTDFYSFLNSLCPSENSHTAHLT